MATKCRALKKLKYRGAVLKPGETFLAKEKDAKLFVYARLAEILEENVEKELFSHGPVTSPAPEVNPPPENAGHPEGPPITPAIGNEPQPIEAHDGEDDEEKIEEGEEETDEGTSDKASESEPNKEELWDKTKPELRKMCESLGIEYKTNDTKGYMIDKICSRGYKRRDMRAED